MSTLYVFDKMNNRYEALSKEQTLAAIMQAVSTGEIKDVDAGFVTTVQEMNKATGLRFWIGTQAQYNALTEKVVNCFYIVTDDTSDDDLAAYVVGLNERLTELENGFSALPRNQILYENADGYVASVGLNEIMSNGLVDAMLKYNHIAVDIMYSCFNSSISTWTNVFKTVILQKRDYGTGNTKRFLGSYVRDIYIPAEDTYTVGTVNFNFNNLTSGANKLSISVGFANNVEYAHIEGEGSEGDVTILRITGMA